MNDTRAQINHYFVVTLLCINRDDRHNKDLCYAMLCYDMLCYVTFCYNIYIRLCYVILCYVMLCYVKLCYVMLCYAMLCYAMLSYAILSYAMLNGMSRPISLSSISKRFSYRMRPRYIICLGASSMYNYF